MYVCMHIYNIYIYIYIYMCVCVLKKETTLHIILHARATTLFTTTYKYSTLNDFVLH